ncbi:SDR family oxidoreductase [Nocardioides sp. R1-1]|uniref:SDR family oxidoreductase n=1 Tax=Nocardioides sp. R1-1 TaxID=3383502 RepID=UPI0038CF5313
MSTNYLVTGGAGFIGSHLVETLVRQGDRVRVLDDLSSGHLANLRAVQDDVEVVVGDIRDRDLVARAMDGVEVVLHQAALASVPASVADPVGSTEVNVMGTATVLAAAQRAGVRRFVQASSSAVYGDAPVLPKRVEMRPEPRSPYAVAKLAAETLGQAFHASYGLETVALRYFNVFGPRQDPHSAYAAVIPLFVAAVRDGRPVTVHGDGLQSRDFIYVENVVRANLLAASTDAAVGGSVFNVATGTSVTLLEMLEAVCEIVGRPAGIEHHPARVGDVRHSAAECGPLRETLGWEPTVDLREGLRRTIASATELRASA